MLVWLDEYNTDILCEALMQNIKERVEDLKVKVENAKASLPEIDALRVALIKRQKLFLKILKQTSKIFRLRSLSDLDFSLMGTCPPKYLQKDLRHIISSDIGYLQSKEEYCGSSLPNKPGKVIEVDFSGERRKR